LENTLAVAFAFASLAVALVENTLAFAALASLAFAEETFVELAVAFADAFAVAENR
jgi:hypothetical protein